MLPQGSMCLHRLGMLGWAKGPYLIYSYSGPEAIPEPQSAGVVMFPPPPRFCLLLLVPIGSIVVPSGACLIGS